MDWDCPKSNLKELSPALYMVRSETVEIIRPAWMEPVARSSTGPNWFGLVTSVNPMTMPDTLGPIPSPFVIGFHLGISQQFTSHSPACFSKKNLSHRRDVPRRCRKDGLPELVQVPNQDRAAEESIIRCFSMECFAGDLAQKQ